MSPRAASSLPRRSSRCRSAATLGVIVLAIRRASGEMLFNPPAEAVLQGGDCLIVMGEQETLQTLEHRLAAVRA